MTEIATLLTGIFVAAVIFAGLLFSAVQAFRQSGALARTHLVLALLIIGAMAALSADLWGLSRLIGWPVALTGLVCAALETRWNRLLPLLLAGFGAILVAGIPFGG